jgi:hypothetical protein
LSSASAPWQVNPAAPRTASISLSFRNSPPTVEVFEAMLAAITPYMERYKDPSWTQRIVRTTESGGSFASLHYMNTNGTLAMDFTVTADVIANQTLVQFMTTAMPTLNPPAGSGELLSYVEASADVVLSEVQDTLQSSNFDRNHFTSVTYRVGGARIKEVAAMVGDSERWSAFGTLLAPSTGTNVSFVDQQGRQVTINWRPPSTTDGPLGALGIMRMTPLTGCPVF